MRRKIFAACTAVFAILLCACTGNVQNGTGEKSLYDHGMGMIALLDEMVRDEHTVK